MDYVKEFLEKHGITLTRKNYLTIDRPGVDWRAPLDPELEADLPEELQLHEWVN